jgi:hypothetical protein
MLEEGHSSDQTKQHEGKIEPADNEQHLPY